VVTRALQPGPEQNLLLKNLHTDNGQTQLKTEEEWTPDTLKKGSRLSNNHHNAPSVILASSPPSPMNPFIPLAVDEVIPCTLENFHVLGEPHTPPPPC
jgi:hypothetical protein